MTRTASRPINLTLGLCIAGGLATGLALARPASDSPAATSAPAAATADGEPRYGYPSVEELTAAATDDSAPAGAAATITIADFAYGEPITVAPGSELVVTNADVAPHSVTATDGGFDSGVLNQGDLASIIAPDSPGTYSFFCTVHPSMQGELVVS